MFIAIRSKNRQIVLTARLVGLYILAVVIDPDPYHKNSCSVVLLTYSWQNRNGAAAVTCLWLI